MTRIDDDSPERLLEQMGRAVVPVMPPEREAALQARSAASVDRMLERVAERRQLRRGQVRGAALGVAAVAAAVAVVVGGSWLAARKSLPVQAGAHLAAVSGGVELSNGAGLISGAVNSGLALAAGDVLRTAPGAHASVMLADLAAVELESGTRVKVTSTASGEAKDERLELTEGLISFRVPKLEPGHTLSVRTPDSLVTVRGTRFSVGVERRGADAIVTLVSVSEGRVQVDSHGQTLFLTRGEQWSSGPASPPSVPVASASGAPAAVASETSVERSSPSAPVRGNAAAARAGSSARAVASARARSAAAEVPRETMPTSTLAVENGIYEGALAAGTSTRALSELETLMREHPRSPLIQSARVEHFRVLLKLGNTAAAAAEARRYLSDYRTGFAREEARQIVLRGLGDAD